MKNAGFKTIWSFWLATSAAIFGLVWVAGFTPAAAQGTPQQQQACTPDVMRLCNEFVPDVAKISACMARKRASISPACRAAFPTAVHGRKRASRHHPHHR
jgi:hypothetical protein